MFNFKTFILALLSLIIVIGFIYILRQSAYREGYYQGKLDEIHEFVSKQHRKDSLYDKQTERLHNALDENYELKIQMNK